MVHKLDKLVSPVGLTWKGRLATQTSKNGRSVFSTSPGITCSLFFSGLGEGRRQREGRREGGREEGRKGGRKGGRGRGEREGGIEGRNTTIGEARKERR